MDDDRERRWGREEEGREGEGRGEGEGERERGIERGRQGSREVGRKGERSTVLGGYKFNLLCASKRKKSHKKAA